MAAKEPNWKRIAAIMNGLTMQVGDPWRMLAQIEQVYTRALARSRASKRDKKEKE